MASSSVELPLQPALSVNHRKRTRAFAASSRSFARALHAALCPGHAASWHCLQQ